MRSLRLSVPGLQSHRGAGLGNEVIAWGKAFIAAQELGLRTAHPAWALNERHYRRDFGTSVFDWPTQQALRCLPSISIDRFPEEHDSYADVARELRHRVERHRGPLVVWHRTGMTGGYMGIAGARDFLRTELSRPRHVSADVYAINQRLDPAKVTVALHVRAGDFTHVAGGPGPGEFNRMLPIDWYVGVGRSLRDGLPGRVQFLIFTDDPDNPEVARLGQDCRARVLPLRHRPLLSDVAAMAAADLLVCSVSSLSMLAAFLSEQPYVWFGPQLGHQDGWRSLWGHESRQLDGLTKRNAAAPVPSNSLLTRGVAADKHGRLPEQLLGFLAERVLLKDRRHDLLMYGVVPGR